jgi:hypothetical protein
VQISLLSTGLDKGGYYHEQFLRGRQDLAHRMRRTKIKGTQSDKSTGDDYNTPKYFYKMPFLPDDDQQIHREVKMPKIPMQLQGIANNERVTSNCNSFTPDLNNKNGNVMMSLHKQSIPLVSPHDTSLACSILSSYSASPNNLPNYFRPVNDLPGSFIPACSQFYTHRILPENFINPGICRALRAYNHKDVSHMEVSAALARQAVASQIRERLAIQSAFLSCMK